MASTTSRFVSGLKEQDAKDSIAITENGAVGFSKTKNRLVDFFFHIGSMRSWDASKIATDFAEAYAEDSQRAIETMFLARDCRGGMGEKKVFNACFDWLVQNYPGDAKDVVGLIPEYGSWKTFFDLTDSFRKNSELEQIATGIVVTQWNKDLSSSKGVSLMAKWMPSENASSMDTKKLASYWRNVLSLSSKEYRKGLSRLRNILKIVEADMSSGNWNEINYNAVPAKAGMLYRNAFLRHDEIRRISWLESLQNNDGTAKINTAGLTVADMVKEYFNKSSQYGFDYSFNFVKEDPTIEAAWRDLIAKNQLPKDCPDMIPVMDGSGSMYTSISKGGTLMPIHVSIGLGLFLANVNRGVFKGKAIEYGNHPEFFEVPTNASLLEQIKIAKKHNDCGSTNFEAVMDLVLKTAISNNLSQNEIPQLICFSDMEFDMAMCVSYIPSSEKLLETISRKFKNYGYLLPKMFFWNIFSRSGAIPLIENEMGVGLISGFSQSIMDMVLSHKLDPYQILIEKLDSPRYDLVRKALGIHA